MSIPAWTIVEVRPGLMVPGGSDLVFNGVVLIENPAVPIQNHVMSFDSSDAVSAYFGYESLEHKAAQSYFQGYDNAVTRPRTLFMAKLIRRFAPGFMASGSVSATWEDIRALGTVGFGLRINGHAKAFSLDVAGVNSFSGMCEQFESLLNVAFSPVFSIGLPGIGLHYSSQGRRFILSVENAQIPVTDISAYETAEPGVTDISALLCLTPEYGATQTRTVYADSAAENMAYIQTQTDNWVSFTTLHEPSENEMIEYALWSTGQGVAYEYIPWTTNENALDPDSNTDPASALSTLAIEGTAMPIFGGLNYAMFVMGAIGSIDWEQQDGLINLAFKAQSTLPANVTTREDYETLMKKGYNLYGNWANRNAAFNWLYEGRQFGRWEYIECYLAAIWLSNALQVAHMQGMQNRPRLPYSEAGYTFIHSWCDGVLRRGRVNGAVDTGISLTEVQKAELKNEAGIDISHELYANGYYIQVLDPGAVARGNRASPVINIWYTFAGSVHRISIAATAIS